MEGLDLSVQVTKTDTTIQVKSSYNEAFIKASRLIGGKWNATNKSWDFPLENEELVMRNLAEIYSYSIDNESMVFLYIDVDKWTDYDYTDSLYLNKLLVAKREYRDSDVKLFNGATLIKGGFKSSGGSAKYPRLNQEEGTVIRIKVLEWLADEIMSTAKKENKEDALQIAALKTVI